MEVGAARQPNGEGAPGNRRRRRGHCERSHDWVVLEARLFPRSSAATMAS